MYLLAVAGVGIFSIGLVIGLKEMWSLHRIKAINNQQQQQNFTQLLYRVGLVRGVLLKKYAIDKTGERWDGFKGFTIAKKTKESDGVYSFLLKPNDNCVLASFFPGQHVMVQADVPGQCQTITRAYSLSDCPGQLEHYRITVKKQTAPNDMPEAPSGIMSTYLVDTIEVGNQLKLSAPSGHFCLNVNQQKPLIMIAGGIGITPFISMINAVLNTQSEREMWLFYSTQNHHSRVMYEHLKQVSKSYKNLRVIMCYSAPDIQQEQAVKEPEIDSHMTHHFGRITVDLLQQYLPTNQGEFFVCGSKQMMTQMKENLLLWHVNENNIHFEVVHLSAGAISKPLSTRESNNHAVISFARSGKNLTWHDGDEGTSILSLAEFNGIFIRNSCRSGECGMCRTKVKKGEVLHLVANDASMKIKGTCLPCVAVPNSKEITLDI